MTTPDFAELDHLTEETLAKAFRIEPLQKKEVTTPKEYRNVSKFADPGYKADKKKRYPLNPARLQAAWVYINQPKNKKGYTDEQYQQVKSRIAAAYKKHFGHAPGESGDDKEDEE